MVRHRKKKLTRLTTGTCPTNKDFLHKEHWKCHLITKIFLHLTVNLCLENYIPQWREFSSVGAKHGSKQISTHFLMRSPHTLLQIWISWKPLAQLDSLNEVSKSSCLMSAQVTSSYVRPNKWWYEPWVDIPVFKSTEKEIVLYLCAHDL